VALGKQEIIAIAAGLFAGLLAVAVMAALLVRLDTTIHSADEVQRMVGLPVLGSTPQSAST
jgi:capsular polysaccharide biosynthesis protein